MIKYIPILSVFSVSLLISLSIKPSIMVFMGIFLCILACLKMMDINAFKEDFIKYDLISKKFISYAYLYPLLELYLGLSLIEENFHIYQSVLLFIVGLSGFVSVIYSKYVKKENHNCACVGGNKDVPLGIVSLVENLIMLLMGLYITYVILSFGFIMDFLP